MESVFLFGMYLFGGILALGVTIGLLAWTVDAFKNHGLEVVVPAALLLIWMLFGCAVGADAMSKSKAENKSPFVAAKKDC